MPERSTGMRGPGNTEARSKMGEAGIDTRRGAAIISGENQSHRSGRIDSRLLARAEAVNGAALIEVIGEWAVDLPGQYIIDREVGSGLPGILGIEIVFLGDSVNKAAAALEITVGDAQQEVGTRIAGRKLTARVEAKVTVIIEEKRIGDVEAAPVIAQLECVTSPDPAEVVVQLIGLVQAWLRPVGTEPESEANLSWVISDHGYDRKARACRALHVNVKSEAGGEDRRLRFDSREIEPCVTETQFIQNGRAKDVSPGCSELLVMPRIHLRKTRQC